MEPTKKKLRTTDLSQPATEGLPSSAVALSQPARALLGLRGLNNLGNTYGTPWLHPQVLLRGSLEPFPMPGAS